MSSAPSRGVKAGNRNPGGRWTLRMFLAMAMIVSLLELAGAFLEGSGLRARLAGLHEVALIAVPIAVAVVILAVALYLLLARRMRMAPWRRGPQVYGLGVRLFAVVLAVLQAAALASVMGVLRYGIEPLAIIRGAQPTPAVTQVVHLPEIQVARETTATEPTEEPAEVQATPEPTAIPTLTATVTASPEPTATQSPVPSATSTGTATRVPTAAYTPSPTRTTAPSATPTTIPTSVPPSPSPSPSATQPQGTPRVIILEGALESLQVDGEFAWAAIAVDCLDSAGATLGRVGLTGVDGEYLLPDGTVALSLWIGPALGGSKWWSVWNSAVAGAGTPEIRIKISRVKVPEATNTPRPAPTSTPRPTATSSPRPTATKAPSPTPRPPTATPEPTAPPTPTATTG